jgi:hypothetical protein
VEVVDIGQLIVVKKVAIGSTQPKVVQPPNRFILYPAGGRSTSDQRCDDVISCPPATVRAGRLRQPHSARWIVLEDSISVNWVVYGARNTGQSVPIGEIIWAITMLTRAARLSIMKHRRRVPQSLEQYCQESASDEFGNVEQGRQRPLRCYNTSAEQSPWTNDVDRTQWTQVTELTILMDLEVSPSRPLKYLLRSSSPPLSAMMGDRKT